MKQVYCESCGTCLAISRKALPKYGRIIDLCQYHDCPDEPVEIDLTPVEVPIFVAGEKNKFAQKLNELQPPTALNVLDTADLRDRRKVEDVKSEIESSAPAALLDQMKSLSNTTPEHDISEEPDNE